MKRIVLIVIALAIILPGLLPFGDERDTSLLHAATPTSVEALLKNYEHARAREKRILAHQLADRFLADEVFFTPPPPLRDDLPADSLDALIFYGAECYYFCNNEDSLLQAYGIRALPLLERSYPTLHAHVQSDIARSLFRQGDNVGTIERGEEAVASCKRIGDKRELSRVYATLSYVYIALHQGPEAVDYARKAYDTYRQSGDTLITHSFLSTLTEAYSINGDHQNSIKYGQLALQSLQQCGATPSLLASDLVTLGYAYYTADSLAAAKRVLNESLQLLEQETDHQVATMAHQYMGFVYQKEHNNALAADHYRQALRHARRDGARRDMCNLQRNLYEVLRTTSPAEAMQALEQYTLLRDTLFNEELQAKLSQANASFHNEQLRAENEATRRANRNIMIAVAFIVLFFVLAIAALLYAVRTRSRSIKAMHQLQAARESFFTNVTHEFRTPLTVILGMAAKLRDGLTALSSPATTALAHDLTLVERNSHRLLTLVNQLLDIARATSATGDPVWQQGNVVAFVGMAVEAFRLPAERQGVALSFTAEPTTVDTTFASDYLEKILDNLLSNALKFTPEGGSISVATRLSGKRLAITVSDTGRGILPADQPHVFEPFFQGANNTFTGTGVGLTLVKQLVEALQGNIHVASTPGKGTTFTLQLPLKKADGITAGTPQTTDSSCHQVTGITTPSTGPTPDDELAPKEPLHAAAKGEAPLVLIVEDNRDVAYYIGSILGSGYEVAYAYDGAEGIAKAEALIPDLIVTDVMMPDVDGLSMSRHIRSSQLTNHIPIVIITARATDADRLNGIEAGADAYLYKPFRADELQLRVTKLLEQRRLLQEKFSSHNVIPAAQASASEPTPLPPANRKAGEHEDSESETKADETPAEEAWTDASRAFVECLQAIVFELMPKGEVDTSEVARRLLMSRSQLGRKTKAIVGKPPATYILELRLQEVKRLITSEPQLTLLDIALRCGFADNAHMTHAFRRTFGITPSQYRAEKATTSPAASSTEQT